MGFDCPSLLRNRGMAGRCRTAGRIMLAVRKLRTPLRRCGSREAFLTASNGEISNSAVASRTVCTARVESAQADGSYQNRIRATTPRSTMKVVLNTDFGPMWLPPEPTLWLLGKEGTQGLFDYGPIEESPFALRAVYSCIEDDEKDFTRHINDRWAKWNWYMVDTERDFFLDYSTDLQIGHHRENEHLIGCVQRHGPEEMAVVDVPDDKNYEIVQDTWRSEAVRLHTAELIRP